MDKLEQNQEGLCEEVSQVGAQMGKLMKTIQAVARGQEIMAKIQEKMNQRAHVVVATPNANLATVENLVPPQRNLHVQIPTTTPYVIPPPVLNPLVIKIYD